MILHSITIFRTGLLTRRANVIAEYEPSVPNQLKTSQFVYLANNDPIQNINLLKQFINPKLVVCDTIEFWIQTKPDAVKKMFGMGMELLLTIKKL